MSLHTAPKRYWEILDHFAAAKTDLLVPGTEKELKNARQQLYRFIQKVKKSPECEHRHAVAECVKMKIKKSADKTPVLVIYWNEGNDPVVYGKIEGLETVRD